MDYLKMANLPVKVPFPMTFDSHPFYNPELFPSNMHYMNSYLHPRQRNNSPIDMHTLGMISQLAPHIRRLNAHNTSRADIGYAASKVDAKCKEHNLHVNLDVGLYAPEELSVKVIDDHLVIEGKHDEREADDIGYVSRHFMRRYVLPKGYDPDAIVSKLSSNGVLNVVLPKPAEIPKERIVNIQLEGPNKSCLNITDEETLKNGDAEDK